MMTTVDWYVFSICVAFCAGTVCAMVVTLLLTGNRRKDQ